VRERGDRTTPLHNALLVLGSAQGEMPSAVQPAVSWRGAGGVGAGFDVEVARQCRCGGCSRKSASHGPMQPAVLLRMRYWPPPMLAGAWFQKPCWVLGLAVEVELGGGVSTGVGLGTGLALTLRVSLTLTPQVRANLDPNHPNPYGQNHAHLGTLVDEARRLLGAEGAHVRDGHHDAAAAVVAELVLEVQLARHEVLRASRTPVQLRPG